MMYCSYREFSVKIKEELRERKALSVEGSVVAEHARLGHFRAYIWMASCRQTKLTNATNAKIEIL